MNDNEEYIINLYKDTQLLKNAAKIFYNNKLEFDNYISNNSKLMAVKALKEYLNCGLKEAKDMFDLYVSSRLPLFIKDDRKKKLEKLAKLPLVEELVNKLLNINEDELRTLLMNLSVDELLSIDELFPEKF